MAPQKNSSKESRVAASRGRADKLLNQIRLERCTSILKHPNHKAVLYEFESKLIQYGRREPLDLTPKQKSGIKALKDSGPEMEPTLTDSVAEADDDKEFCRNTNKYADLKFQVWARAFKKT